MGVLIFGYLGVTRREPQVRQAVDFGSATHQNRYDCHASEYADERLRKFTKIEVHEIFFILFIVYQGTVYPNHTSRLRRFVWQPTRTEQLSRSSVTRSFNEVWRT